MNQKQKLQLIGGFSALVGLEVGSRIMNKRRMRIRAQKELERQQAHVRFMKSLEALESDLDTRLETARFWEQVTHDL